MICSSCILKYRNYDTRKERPMKLTIFAATGGIGRQILEQAGAAGPDVTPGARTPPQLPADLSTQVRVATAYLPPPEPAPPPPQEGDPPPRARRGGAAPRPARADGHATDRHLQAGPRAQSAARPLHLTRRCRPFHAPRARAARDDPTGHRRRQLVRRRD